MAYKPGRAAKVTLGTNTVVGMGSWKLSGISVDQLDATAFGDTAKEFLMGLIDYGNIEFSGLYDPADSTGQTVLINALSGKTLVTNIRLYVDATSYWMPDITADAGAGMYVTSVPISFDKSGLGQISFTGKATGPWALV
jgi:hypothetical protein